MLLVSFLWCVAVVDVIKFFLLLPSLLTLMLIPTALLYFDRIAGFFNELTDMLCVTMCAVEPAYRFDLDRFEVAFIIIGRWCWFAVVFFEFASNCVRPKDCLFSFITSFDCRLLL